jgi:hypothetical protein
MNCRAVSFTPIISGSISMSESQLTTQSAAQPVVFTTGGTVQAGNGIYLARQADEDLLELCRKSVFAYILTARQLGKSSLMMRTVERLNSEGIRTVIIDLTAIGVKVTTEEWYLGLLAAIEDQLLLNTSVITWWQEHAHLGMTQRLTMFFEEVLLVEITGPVVVFVDEIDTTLNLNFTDDFFAAIRYFYNARAMRPEFKRLSFVLIGVATPGDLVRDPQRTPFNVGQRVSLTDFTFDEALPLADGFRLPPDEARQVLKWVLSWTSGHPYLTQRLCRAIAEEERIEWSEAEVARVVANTFFGEKSRMDNNLQFVRDMLTKRASDVEGVLTTYRDILRAKTPVRDEEQSLVKSHLKLSGVVRRESGTLQPRNLIYRTVFDEEWVAKHLPVNWTKQLQRAAASLIATLLLLCAPLAIYAWMQRNDALRALKEAQAATEYAESQRRIAEQARESERRQREALEELFKKDWATLERVMTDLQGQPGNKSLSLSQQVVKYIEEQKKKTAKMQSDISRAQRENEQLQKSLAAAQNEAAKARSDVAKAREELETYKSNRNVQTNPRAIKKGD